MFNPADLNIKLLADLHSCDASCPCSSLSLHSSCFNQHVSQQCYLHHRPQPVPHSRIHAKSTHVWLCCLQISFPPSTVRPFDATLVYLVLHCPAVFPAASPWNAIPLCVVPVSQHTSAHQMFKQSPLDFNWWDQLSPQVWYLSGSLRTDKEDDLLQRLFSQFEPPTQTQLSFMKATSSQFRFRFGSNLVQRSNAVVFMYLTTLFFFFWWSMCYPRCYSFCPFSHAGYLTHVKNVLFIPSKQLLLVV